MIKYFFIFIGILSSAVYAQEDQIKIINANQTYSDQAKHPGALVLNGNVKAIHQGAVLTCKKALYYRADNKLIAFGDVFVNQADTLTQSSKFLQYNGNISKAVSWGDVIVKDKDITLTTDTLHFDRVQQHLFYNCFGKIVNGENTLTSQKGRYQAVEKKFIARQNVKLVSPRQNLTTYHLDYYTETGKAYLYGPSNIKNPQSTIYTEKGIYDTKTDIGFLLKNSTIYHENKEISGDSLYYNKQIDLATGTGNLVVTDTINNIIIKGDYGEIYQAKDSIVVTKKPVAITIVEQDSMFIHGDSLMLTGDQENRLMKIYHRVKFFKSDISGKCDSLVAHQDTGITEMFRNPVLWSDLNQITGDTIQLLRNKVTNKIDSLHIKRNALIVQKDSVGYNQIQGRNMYGEFEGQKLSSLLVKGNGAVVNYARDDKGILTAIMNMVCSNILFSLEEGKMKTIQFLKKPEGKTYPPLQFPEDKKELKGFIWRDAERPYKREDIFIYD